VQFLAGQDNDVYELSMVDEYQEVRHYQGCTPIPGGACAITPDDAAWEAIAAKFSGRDVPLMVSGLSTDDGTRADSSPRTLRFTGAPLDAGLYYWNAGDGTLMRFDFGHAGAPPELFYNTPSGFCVGCHALSRDGTLAAVGIDSPSPSGIDVLDVATGDLLWQGYYGQISGSNYHAFSPDSTMLLTTDGYTLEVRDALTGVVLPYGNVNVHSLFPDWSPDSATIVYSDIGSSFCTSSPCSTFTTSTGSIAVRTFDGSGFGDETMLVQYDGQYNNYYPAFTPDSQWIVFNRVAQGEGFSMDSYNNSGCRLWAVPTTGGEPIHLGRADGGYTGNTWPKVAPVMYPYAGGMVTFFTFTSTRPIGVRPAGASQIWMAAFDPARAEAGDDPSFPAVHMPWQGTFSANHIAQWAQDIPHEPCGPMGECPTGEFCEGGECIPDID
jgi:hypothetical protein